MILEHEHYIIFFQLLSKYLRSFQLDSVMTTNLYTICAVFVRLPNTVQHNQVKVFAESNLEPGMKLLQANALYKCPGQTTNNERTTNEQQTNKNCNKRRTREGESRQ